jgi:signal transduction histidine kinase
MKAPDLKLSHKIIILVSVPIVFMLVFVSVLTVLQKKAEDEIWRERHSKAVIAECNTLMRNFMDAGMFLYLFEQTHQLNLLKRYQGLSEQIPVQLNSLRMMMRESPHKEAVLEELNRAGNAVVGLQRSADEMIERKSTGGHSEIASHAEFLATSSQMLSCLRQLIKEQQEVERTNPQKEAFLRSMIVYCMAAGIAASIVLAITLAVYFNRALTSRLLVLVDNTNRLASGKALNQQLAGTDEIAHLDAVFHDMTEKLADAARRKQELIQMVTHDLRTPLTAIDASLLILTSGRAGNLSEIAMKRVQSAKRSSERLLNLINDLLDIERLETGNFPLDKKKVMVQQLLENATDSVRAFAADRGVTLQTKETDATVFADAARLEQILINLISNAVKFSPEGASVELTIDTAGDQTEFQVIDHGRGVPKEYQTVIFERFGQVKQEDSARGKGTGLGLPICKALVEAHKGSIGVRSEEGAGSIFWFRIPQSQE